MAVWECFCGHKIRGCQRGITQKIFSHVYGRRVKLLKHNSLWCIAMGRQSETDEARCGVFRFIKLPSEPCIWPLRSGQPLPSCAYLDASAFKQYEEKTFFCMLCHTKFKRCVSTKDHLWKKCFVKRHVAPVCEQCAVWTQNRNNNVCAVSHKDNRARWFADHGNSIMKQTSSSRYILSLSKITEMYKKQCSTINQTKGPSLLQKKKMGRFLLYMLLLCTWQEVVAVDCRGRTHYRSVSA